MRRLKELAGEQERLQNEVRRAAEGKLKRLFEAAFDDFPELDQIVIAGRTPHFNDGDACTHSQDTHFVAGEDVTSDVTSDWEGGTLGEGGDVSDLYYVQYFLGKEAEGDDIEHERDPLRPLTPEFATEERSKERQEGARYVDQFEDTIEMTYGTDFVLVVTRGADKEIAIERHDHPDHD